MKLSFQMARVPKESRIMAILDINELTEHLTAANARWNARITPQAQHCSGGIHGLN